MPEQRNEQSAATTCPRCGAETTEAQLTYSGCPMCQAEAAENARQDAADEAHSAATTKLPHVREQRLWRLFWLTPVCLIRGHVPALIRPIVPNPYATESWVEGCGRCSRCPL